VPPPALQLLRIAPEIPVVNWSEAIEYYGKRLGFAVVMEMPAGDYAIVERDGVAIHLFRQNHAFQSPVGVHIFARDLDELYEEFQSRGVAIAQEIMGKPWGNRDFRVNDPSGNVLKFTESL
jgi:uncharacterized glyoxalase superfamily protein PhnB